MSELEKFVNTVQSLSASGDYTELYGKLGKFMEVLLKHASNLDTVLETLSIPQHTLGVMAVLLVKLTTATLQNPADGHCLLAQVQDFIKHCNKEQVQLASNILTEMCHSATGLIIQLQCPLKGIEILRSAIKRIQTSKVQLTSAHADLIQLCLLAKCFKPALEFLDVDIMSISQENSQADSRYFLLYFYYGGLVYAALKNYERALYFLEVVVTTPAMAVSHIMLEAYKKYILVSLILHGKVVDVPKYTCLVVARFIKPLSLPYLEVSTAYATSSCDEVSKVLTKNQDTFARDGNMGLAKQVLYSLRKKNIQRLTKTFLTLSLADVASRVELASPREAEQAILNMIEDGEIFASINQKDGMVVFHDDPEKYNGPAALRRLEEEMAKCVELDRRVQQMDEEMMVNPQFIKKQQCSSTDDDLTAITPGLATGGLATGGLATGSLSTGGLATGGPSNSTI